MSPPRLYESSTVRSPVECGWGLWGQVRNGVAVWFLQPPGELPKLPAGFAVSVLRPAPVSVLQVMTEPQAVRALFGRYSRYPSPVAAAAGPEEPAPAGGRYISLLTEWTQAQEDRGQRVRFGRQYTLLRAGRTELQALPPGQCCHLQGEVLSSQSPSGSLKAVVRDVACHGAGARHQALEIWNKNGLAKSMDLTSLDKHGRVYEDAQFGCLAWSGSESRVLYVAEKRHRKAESSCLSESGPANDREGAGPAAEEEEPTQKEDQCVYWEDWGEGLAGKSTPILCVADVDKGSVSVLRGVPRQVSPGQAFWAPGDGAVVFVGWWHEPFRLGLRFCTNRRSALFSLDLEGNCELLSPDTTAVSSPRLSPDGRYIAYLQGQVFGPHAQCLRLQQFDRETRKTALLLDLVKRPGKGEFAGLYEPLLPRRCWAADSQRLVFSSARRSRKDVFVLDTVSRRVTRLSDSSEFGSWKLLAIERDLMVVSCSSINCPPCLKVGFLPPAGGEDRVSWVPLDDLQCVPSIEWQIMDFTPPPEEENKEYSGLDFDALVLKPRGSRAGARVPLVVFAHGGPHSQFSAEWNAFSAALVTVGFSVLMVNYRGSTGFGQDSIVSLIGNMGSQDVKDVQRAVVTLLQSDATLDPRRVAVLGGSHGGFLACHLVGQYPDFYRACAARNPVINYATLLGTSDIIDWRYTAAGLPYSFDQLPTADALAAMLEQSPIVHAPQIRAPVLLMLGGRDKRVSPHQGLELYRAMKSRGSPVRLLWFEEDGHSLSRVDTQSSCFVNVVLWFLRHLDIC
ncbi:acylamino-acid-releasing enzyme isoform X1 [Lepisosteus oculatus]|uniref:acylamino-acid-releasing enzyme isoform X1 n=2 Tax=Lepisosteus oculatus TaxID=7918 RepID=UPI0037151522